MCVIDDITDIYRKVTKKQAMAWQWPRIAFIKRLTSGDSGRSKTHRE